MRRLLYIPVIHDDADLGSSGPALACRSAVLAGESRWAGHRETARRFWGRVADYLSRFDSTKMRVYQDGLASDGTAGKRIVEAAARRGSRNYQLVLKLLKGGAQLQATEDAALLALELANLGAAGDESPSPEQRQHLLEARDTYILDVISSTLQPEELGILFIGAGHDLLGRLAADFQVQTVKDPDKLRIYIQELLLARDSKKLEAMAQYVAAPIDEPIPS